MEFVKYSKQFTGLDLPQQSREHMPHEVLSMGLLKTFLHLQFSTHSHFILKKAVGENGILRNFKTKILKYCLVITDTQAELKTLRGMCGSVYYIYLCRLRE